MRGVVSLAAALAIPLTLAGESFPQRNLILFITFIVILLTLVLQGLTLPYFIKRAKLSESLGPEESDESVRQRVRHDLRQHVLELMKSKYNNELQGHIGMEGLLRQWEEKAKMSDDQEMNEKKRKFFLEILESQRQYLAELNKDADIDEEIIRERLFQIDLEEERLRAV